MKKKANNILAFCFNAPIMPNIGEQSMDNQWKDENCGTCDFAMDWEMEKVTVGMTEEGKIFKFIMEETGERGQCRKNPPIMNVNERYPSTRRWTKACSCWREKQ